ncbi:TetR/AcrR family transcriptional regulator [Aliidiomarina minuta]|uniref:TetR/AcrR family transcriptional regulator n=1 Tax=Aliidiomarina minuta TaxID=880057 RepID=A0A432W5Y1_9GAMM|nr:TetR/AcrR family transcriptional regulator [Aliidiomarina minuta]RUO25467.1 TetR/AcrR family transcriptional regulator [Aliidiomarina minuta]
MAYRETEKVRNRKAATREQVLQCALVLVAQSGFSGIQMTQLAKQAKLATGTLYRYFPSKESLFAEVFKRATEIEVARVERALQQTSGEAPDRIEEALRVFARRALKAPNLAWALIAEPVQAEVDQQRLEYRMRYARLFADAIQQGIDEGSLPLQRSMLSSTAMVGAIAEALIGPLAKVSREMMVPANQQQIIDDILRFCIHGILCSAERRQGAPL